MVKSYETMVVFDGTLPDEVLKKEQEKIEKFLKERTTFERTDLWGKMALAYEINRKKTGNYCLFLYKGDGDIATQFDHEFKLDTAILRHLTVVRNEKAPTKLIDPDRDLAKTSESQEEAANGQAN